MSTTKQQRNLARRKTIAAVTNFIRSWQMDGMPGANDHFEASSDEAFEILAWLERRRKICRLIS